ncbi:type II toxin-antitoxin system RelE/ParE family toxin [Methylobacterium oryzisoli]|uniref:type II toxin-antitoxin system RelE/ParE family toxin n=1 Tax=Methylobacterium oryzisoli TaxID=3385502 RepID=UPI0038928521
MIRSFRSKALKRYWTRNDPSGIRPDWAARVRSLLNRLDAAEQPDELNTPGSGFHPLTGDQAGRFALTVSRNWRLTFRFDRNDAVDVDLEDYHGR